MQEAAFRDAQQQNQSEAKQELQPPRSSVHDLGSSPHPVPHVRARATSPHFAKARGEPSDREWPSRRVLAQPDFREFAFG